MKTKTTCLTEEQCKIRDEGERNNAKVRESMLPSAEEIVGELTK